MSGCQPSKQSGGRQANLKGGRGAADPTGKNSNLFQAVGASPGMPHSVICRCQHLGICFAVSQIARCRGVRQEEYKLKLMPQVL